MTYQGVDNYGDKAKFFGRFDANVSKAYAEEYTLSLAEYESLMKKSDNYVSVNTDSKENVQFDTLAIFQENVIASYSNILNLTDGLKNVIENAEGYTVTPIAKACDFNQSLFKNAIYTNPALLSDTNLGLFHVPVQTDYVKNGTALLDVSPVSINEAYDTARFHIDYFEKSGNWVNFREAKVTIDTKDFSPANYSDISEYVYTKFTEGDVKFFSQNEVKPDETVEDDILGL